MRYLRTVLITRIYEFLSPLQPMWGGQTRLIAFITGGAQIRSILYHIGVDAETSVNWRWPAKSSVTAPSWSEFDSYQHPPRFAAYPFSVVFATGT